MGKLDVDVAPPDIVGALGVVDDALVFGTAAGFLSREGHQGSFAGDGAAFVTQRKLVERCGSCVSVNFLNCDAVGCEREGHEMHLESGGTGLSRCTGRMSQRGQPPATRA